MERGRKGNDATNVKAVHDGDEGDRVSELPNDILISITHRLTFREATATSVLSTRWRHLHTHATHLHFPPFKPVWTNDVESEKRRFQKHIEMINRVMDSHSGGPVKELKVEVPSFKVEGGISSMKKWVEFALTKDDIETVDLRTTWPCDWPSGVYNLGLSEVVVGQGQGLEYWGASKCLKRLILEWVSVNDHDLELVVSSFVALESLRIRGSRELERVSIVGHPQLMHLDISHVSNLRSVEIRDVANLFSLSFHLPPGCAQHLHNLPAFSQFYAFECRNLTCPYDHLFAGMASSIRDQLQLLHLSTRLEMMDIASVHRPFQFANVKHLEVEVYPMNSWSHCIRVWPLLEACQSIEKFKIKFVWSRYDVESMDFGEKGAVEYYLHFKKLSSNLKEVVMEGYAGCETEFKLTSYIINYAENLERLIVVAFDENSFTRAQEDFRGIRPPLVLDLHIT